MTKLEPLPPETVIPGHVAIICDGNRRWARARNKPNFAGHQAGFNATPKLAKAARDLGVHTLSFWAFSTENWDRPKKEIAFLMKKYEDFVEAHLKDAIKDNVKIIHLGRKDRLPKSLIKKIKKAEEKTAGNTGYVLNIALDYGGHDEILRAIEKLKANGINKALIDETKLSSYLDTATQPHPYPDLLIRPSGEQRTSGMFSWQSAYTEYYWLADHFPDFTPEKLREAIVEFSCRRRRFGGNDDIPKVKFDPKKLAKIEVGWWQAHNDGDNQKLAKLLVAQIVEQYGLSQSEAKETVGFLVEAVKFHNKRNWSGAIGAMTKYWQIIKKETGMVFDPGFAAKLEIDWWQIHDQLEDEVDKEPLEKAFAKLFGELYRLSNLQVAKLAHLRAMATFEHDLAEKKGVSQKEARKHWQKTEDFLAKSYRALREVAS